MEFFRFQFVPSVEKPDGVKELCGKYASIILQGNFTFTSLTGGSYYLVFLDNTMALLSASSSDRQVGTLTRVA